MENPLRSERLHIGLFGRCNSGKSSLINALTGQRVAVVSEIAGTTTDGVSRNMELPEVGAVVFIDTAGFDDSGALGAKRVEQTRRAADRCDIAIVVFAGDGDMRVETEWIDMFRRRNIPVIIVLNKCDLLDDVSAAVMKIHECTGERPLLVNALTGEGITTLRKAIAESMKTEDRSRDITGDLVGLGDVVMLVMPQDAQAPKGRLILPQVQVIRELLDKGCTTVCCQTDGMAAALAALSAPPRLIITDSQAFAAVSAILPEGSLLTSFSVLLAAYKGDIGVFREGAKQIDRLTENSKVLIAEACTHAPASEDIGRVKIPHMLRRRIGEGLRIDVVSGEDFPNDLSAYDLVIHCGACMFNRRLVLSRTSRASSQGVPMTNYGIALAYLTGILDKVVLPEDECKECQGDSM